MTIDHASVEMACAAGNNLSDGKTVAGKAAGVIVSLNVSGKYSDGMGWRKRRQGSFEKSGFAGARRTDEIHAKNILLAVALAQLRGQAIIFAQNFFLYDFAHGSSNSK